ncbi:hypothetical protein RHSIM_Rhsim03G0182400 [Rhododendron simsii]|uniref:Uncharacterized protein n=1 Tax=Rhododendron simsii TaxID=118357 RepID=A0A834LU97_RHOSS|nr:hypothetical protein RHSIM_Rhsim03G0182400 [Rhododendron simsii]
MRELEHNFVVISSGAQNEAEELLFIGHKRRGGTNGQSRLGRGGARWRGKAVEDGAVSEVAVERETATVGRFIVTPVLRSSVAEPRSGDGGIGASEPVPFGEGDFLESANPRDILGALGVDSPDVQAAATLLRVILSQDEGSAFGAEESEEIPEEMPESETVVEERLTALNEAKAFATAARPEFSPRPILHRTSFQARGDNKLCPNQC